MNQSYSIGYDTADVIETDVQFADGLHDKAMFSEDSGKLTMDTDYYQIFNRAGFLHAFVASLSVIIVSELGDKTFFIAAILAMKNSRMVVFVASMLALGIMTVLASVMGVATTVIPRVYIHYTSVVLFVIFGLKMLKEGYDMSPDEAKEELDQVQSSLEKKDQNQQANGFSSCNRSGTSHIANHNSMYASEDPETGVIKALPEVPLKTRIKRKFLVFVSLAFIETFTMIFVAEWGDRSQISTLILAARENVVAVTIGALLGHFLCTGLAVLGGRFIAQMISVKTAKGSHSDSSQLLDFGLALLLNQKSEDDAKTPAAIKEYLLNDHTNEFIGLYTTQDIIARSGFNYENHYTVSQDGYITNLIRIVNPLADRSKLKQPPVMMMHGGITDTATWVWNSAIQHHPEPYPRTVDEPSMTSWNRSLAFVLANNGYDVWLVGTRGSNLQNKGHLKYRNQFSWFEVDQFRRQAKSKLEKKKRQQRKKQLDEGPRPDNEIDVNSVENLPMNLGDNADFQVDHHEALKYWNYTMDEIRTLEVPVQQQKVLEISGAEKVILIDLSFATMLDLALLTENHLFASRVHRYVTFAPILNNIGTNNAMKLFHKTFCIHAPDSIGTLLITQLLLSQPLRSFLLTLNRHKDLRYSFIKQITRLLAGPSARYDTGLDSGVVGNVLKSTGFKEIKHYCQQVNAGGLQRFDYGPGENMRIYGQKRPPKYDLAQARMPNWFLISGGNDVLATVSSVQQLLRLVGKKPDKHIFIDRYNHLDLIAGFEVDYLINLPILEYLDSNQLPPLGEMGAELLSNSIQSTKRSLELEKYVPQSKRSKSSHILEGHMRRSLGSVPSNSSELLISNQKQQQQQRLQPTCSC